MTGSPPAIVVTLPARTVVEARAQLDEASRSGADLIEIRFDRFEPGEIDHVADLFPNPHPLVATVRSRAEGGEGPDDARTRGRLLNELSRHPFRWIDVELARDFPAAETLFRAGRSALIVSSHLPATVSEAEWRRQLRAAVPSGAIRKVVVPASVGRLLRELIPALPPSGESPLVAHTTGASGPLLRAWSKRFDFPLVYASLPGGNGSEPVEPSQIPVDRLRRFLDSGGAEPLFAVVGHPVAHSRSPELHARWMQDGGHAGLYVPLDFESDAEFVDSLPFLIDGGFLGLNVTRPLKPIALEVASRVGPGAAACGVANTLTLASGEVEAENTDLSAILHRLEELRSSGDWDGGSLGVVGAGGAARATLAAAGSLGVEAHVWARRPEASESLAREFGAHAIHRLTDARPSLVVHATPVGRETREASALPELGDWLRPGVPLLDWVYAPAETVLRAAAARAHTTYEDGSRLLVYQAASSYGIWWGEEPSPGQVADALRGVSP